MRERVTSRYFETVVSAHSTDRGKCSIKTSIRDVSFRKFILWTATILAKNNGTICHIYLKVFLCPSPPRNVVTQLCSCTVRRIPAAMTNKVRSATIFCVVLSDLMAFWDTSISPSNPTRRHIQYK